MSKKFTHEKFMLKNITTTKDQVMKIIKMNEAFYAVDLLNIGSYEFEFTYDEVVVYYNRNNHLTVHLYESRCKDDHVIEEQEFHLIDGQWLEVSQYDGEYYPPLSEDRLDTDEYIVRLRSAGPFFTQYVVNLLKILR